MSFEYSFGSKLGGVLAFRVVSLSIACACVAKQASQTVSWLLRPSAMVEQQQPIQDPQQQQQLQQQGLLEQQQEQQQQQEDSIAFLKRCTPPCSVEKCIF